MPTVEDLRLNRPPVNIRLESGQTAELMAIAMALQMSLRTVLEELAAAHDLNDGDWLQDLEETLLRDASNIWAQGLPLDAELRALDGGRKAVRNLIDALRKQLAGI